MWSRMQRNSALFVGSLLACAGCVAERAAGEPRTGVDGGAASASPQDGGASSFHWRGRAVDAGGVANSDDAVAASPRAAQTDAGASGPAAAVDASQNAAVDPTKCVQPKQDQNKWTFAAPDTHGLDPAKLQLAADYAATQQSQCLVVVRHGAIVGEWYWRGTDASSFARSWSVGKSYAATVVGVALQRGDLPSVDTKVSEYVKAWSTGPRASISVRHLMSMTSGLAFNLVEDNLGMVLAKDMTAKALASKSDAAPGSAWRYSNHTVQVVEAVLRAATAMAPDTYADLHLWKPLGIKATWARDKSGQPAMYMNVMASCRDHAKLGMLYLQNGCWNGQRLLPKQWVAQATAASSTLNKGYGWWWWRNGDAPVLSSVDFSPKHEHMHPFAPKDAYCAVGLGNQFVEVIPSLDMVVVRMGLAPPDDPKMLLKPKKLIAAMKDDDKQWIHNKVLKMVLDAL